VKRVEPEPERLLMPHEAAALFGVAVDTLATWERAGKIGCVWTLGHKRRYREAEVLALRQDHDVPAVAS
jgi:predicted site-specific integrase-resolvase